MNTLIRLLQLAGLLHLGLLAAGAMLPRVLGFRTHLSLLPAPLRRLFLVYYGFIGGLVACFGLVSWFAAEPLARGGGMATVWALLMMLFWLARLGVALFVFDMRPYLTHLGRRLGYYALNGVFLYLLCLYTYLVWKGLV